METIIPAIRKTRSEAVTGKCRLCLNLRVLCESHAIPDAFFKKVNEKKRSDGKLIAMVADLQTSPYKSNDTLQEHLLCNECESQLNEEFDSYGINVFCGVYGRSRRKADGVEFQQIDRKRLRLFVLSVIWRVSVSDHPGYGNVNLPTPFEELLRRYMINPSVEIESEFSISICRLRDTKTKTWSMEGCRGVVLLPIGRRWSHGMSIMFVAMGFEFQVFLVTPPRNVRKKNGFLFGKKPSFVAPYIEVTEIPELLKILAENQIKYRQGIGLT